MKHVFLFLLFPFIINTTQAQTGNIGIGTSSPGSKLTVNGSFASAYKPVTANYTMTAADFYVVSNSASNSTITLPAALAAGSGNFQGRLYEIKNTHPTSTLTVRPNGSELIDDVGATGVGSITVSPGDGVLLVSNGNTTGTTWEVVSFHSATPTKDYDWLKVGGTLPTSPGDINQSMYHGSGNIGMNTANPVTQLHLRTNNAGGTFPRALFVSHNCGPSCGQRPGLTLGLINENKTDPEVGPSIGFMEEDDSDTASAAIYLVNRSAGNKFGGFSFRTRSLISQRDPIERMRITPAGNVGIGATAPTSKLHVAGDVRIVDGTQGAGKLFVSDANGVGSWQSPAQTKEIMALGNAVTQNVLNGVAAGGATTLTNFSELVNTIPGASFNTGTDMLTLPAGTYEVSVSYEFSGSTGTCPAAGFLINSYFIDFPNNGSTTRVHANSPSICGGQGTHAALWNMVIVVPAGGQSWTMQVGRGQGGNYTGEVILTPSSRVLVKRIL